MLVHAIKNGSGKVHDKKYKRPHIKSDKLKCSSIASHYTRRRTLFMGNVKKKKNQNNLSESKSAVDD